MYGGSARDRVPFCEELPHGAATVCGMQRRGHTGGGRYGHGTLGLQRPHHSADKSHKPVPVVGTTSVVDIKVPNGSAGHVVRGMGTLSLSVVITLGVTFSEARAWFSNTEQREAAQTAETLHGVLSAQTTYAWGRPSNE